MTAILEGRGVAVSEVTAGERTRQRLLPPMPHDGRWGWLGPLLVTLVAAFPRFWDLSRPRAVVFDETYYVKDALSLLRFGYEQQTVQDANDRLLAGKTDIFTGAPEFVVHPPLGKWVVAAGEWLFGVTPFGWRFATALVGTLTVWILARVVRRMTRSTLLGCLAGLLLALDGLHLVLSRTAILDVILTFFIVCAFACLVVDRDFARSRLASLAEGVATSAYGSSLLWRPWRLASGVLLGAACATKWSGIYFLAAFGLMTFFWDHGARRSVGIRRPLLATLRLDAVPALLSIVGSALLIYVVSWSGWLLTSGGWDRQWATNRSTSFPFIPDALRSLWHYHAEMWRSNTTLHSPHAYASKPGGWPLLARPVSMYYAGDVQPCDSKRCVSAVLALGNPAIWWFGILTVLFALWLWAARRDWRAGAALAGIAAGWLPWFLYSNRTIFSWYSVVYLPFTIITIVLFLGWILGPPNAPPERRTWGAAVVGAYVMVVLAMFAYFLPIWTGEVIPYTDWLRHMWFRRWV